MVGEGKVTRHHQDQTNRPNQYCVTGSHFSNIRCVGSGTLAAAQ
jgi:hypothetical protein